MDYKNINVEYKNMKIANSNHNWTIAELLNIRKC